MNNARDIQEDWTLEMIEVNRGLIKGVKVRLKRPYVRSTGVHPTAYNRRRAKVIMLLVLEWRRDGAAS